MAHTVFLPECYYIQSGNDTLTTTVPWWSHCPHYWDITCHLLYSNRDGCKGASLQGDVDKVRPLERKGQWRRGVGCLIVLHPEQFLVAEISQIAPPSRSFLPCLANICCVFGSILWVPITPQGPFAKICQISLNLGDLMVKNKSRKFA